MSIFERVEIILDNLVHQRRHARLDIGKIARSFVKSLAMMTKIKVTHSNFDT